MLKANYHLHSEFCPHGKIKNTEDVVKLAILEDFEVIGFSEHAPLPDDFNDPSPLKDSYINDEQMHEYVKQIRSLQKKYKGQIEIKLGLEVDYAPKYAEQRQTLFKKYNIDFGISSVHFIDGICIDFSKQEQEKLVNYLGSWQMLEARYYELVADMIDRCFCDVIGHLDLIKKFGRKITLNEQIERILMKIKKRKKCLEINSSGLHKDVTEQYPSLEIIKRADELEIPLVFGTDSHDLKSMQKDYKKIINLLKPYNIKLSNL